MSQAAARAAVAPVAGDVSDATTFRSPRAASAGNGGVSVTVLCDGAEPVDFKMKATTALETWRSFVIFCPIWFPNDVFFDLPG